MNDKPALVALAFLYLIIPAALGRWFNGASWLEIAKAFGILWGVLLLLGIAMGSTWGERIGWPMIFGMFFSIPGVPIILWLMRILGWR